MSLGQDFLSGYSTTSGARERKRDRADKISQEALRKQFELDRDAERYKQEDLGRRAGFDNQTAQRIGGEDFTGRENEKGRTHGTNERMATQGFTAEQAAADRALRQKLQDDSLNQAAAQFAKTNDREYQNMGLMAGFKARDEEARLDPNNPATQLNAERLAKLKRENAEATGAVTTPTATPATPRKALTPQDAAALAWAKANPNSPQAKQILERLGVK